MADRGRDLKISILSDTSRFDLGGVADDLTDTGKAADRMAEDVESAADELKRLAAQGKDAERDLAALNRETADNRFEEYGRDADKMARDVDDAFDAIARSAKTGAKKVDDELEHAGSEGFDNFKDEAAGSGREAAASFSGNFSDIGGTIQEIAANAFAGFGPLGTAAGIAAGLGIGLITKAFSDSADEAEKAKERAKEYFDLLVEGQGKIQEEALQGRIQELFGDADKFQELSKNARAAGVSVALYGRALAGDVNAAKQVAAQVQAVTTRLDKNTDESIDATAAQRDQRIALQNVSKELGITEQAIKDGTTAWQAADEAMRAGITANIDVKPPTTRELANERAAIEKGVAKPVTVPVKVSPAQAEQEARAARARMQAWSDRHPVTIPVVGRTGQRPIRDVP